MDTDPAKEMGLGTTKTHIYTHIEKIRLSPRNLAAGCVCVYACLFLVSTHYWAPTVLSPDGKPFDKKLTKVLPRLPVVNVFNHSAPL